MWVAGGPKVEDKRVLWGGGELLEGSVRHLDCGWQRARVLAELIKCCLINEHCCSKNCFKNLQIEIQIFP